MAYYSGDVSSSTLANEDKSKSVIVSRKKGHSDVNLKLTRHPLRKDIIPLRDDAAIKHAVKNLLLTNFYERPFQPEKGANLRGLLFEPADSITKYELATQIRETIEEFEPRVAVNRVRIFDESEINSFRIRVDLKILEFDSNEEIEIVLQRLR
jgi:phage baseplate assembly protein W